MDKIELKRLVELFEAHPEDFNFFNKFTIFELQPDDMLVFTIDGRLGENRENFIRNMKNAFNRKCALLEDGMQLVGAVRNA